MRFLFLFIVFVLVQNCERDLLIYSVGLVELAAIRVSVSDFNLVSKLFNVPLLNIRTSCGVEEKALYNQGNGGNSQIDYVISFFDF